MLTFKIEVEQDRFFSLGGAQALTVEPRRAQACQNFLQPHLEPELFPLTSMKFKLEPISSFSEN